jgi:hypothetical protein
VRRDEVRDLRGIDARAAADRDEAVDPGVAREVGGLLQRGERRLDVGTVVDHDLDPLGLDGRAHALGVAGGGHARIGDEQRASHAQPGELPARVGGRSGAELDRRRLQREHRFAVGRRRHRRRR